MKIEYKVLFLVLLLGLILAFATVSIPVATTIIVVAICISCSLVLLRSKVDKMLGFAICTLLAGYAFLGKGFAYLGFPPIYIGEVTLAILLGMTLARGGMRLAFRSPLSWGLLVFALWGAFRTIPYIGIYRIDAARDAVIWAYSVFAVLVATFLLRLDAIRTVPQVFEKFCGPFLLWVVPALALVTFFGNSIPRILGTSEPFLDIKPGDTAVHLAGVASFLLLGLHRQANDRSNVSPVKEGVWWVLILLSAVLATTSNRGGLLAFLAACLVAIGIRPIANAAKVLLCAFFFLVLIISNTHISTLRADGSVRDISATQLKDNFSSVFGKNSEDLDGTRQWRIDWWNKIIDYTVKGPYFWGGKGFGINLADDDGFQVTDDHSLRSPHNGHLTILARSGVPGLAIWIGLQMLFGFSLIRCYFIAISTKNQRLARLNVWIFCYWLAFLINGTFDVFLEGPQGGIWFWCWFGFGIAAIEYQLQEHRLNRMRVANIATASFVTAD